MSDGITDTARKFKKGYYKTLTLKLGKTILTKDISSLTYYQQVLMVTRIRKHLSIKLKKKTWVDNFWAIPKKTPGKSLRFSTRSYIMLS